MRRVVVIGGGASGVATAWSAATSGAQVTLLYDRPGATELWSGAIDDFAPVPGAAPRGANVGAFLAALGGVRLGGAGVRIATSAGLVRLARGSDHALLDLTPLAGARVAVAELAAEDFDARLVARGLAASAWACATGTAFEPVAVAETAPAATVAAVAASLDTAAGRERLVTSLERSSIVPDAWLFAPCLGFEPATIDALRQAVQAPVGEVTSRPGGVAGVRFRSRRQRLLADLGVESRCARVESLRRVARGVAVELASEPPSPPPGSLEADAVVLAVGGLVGGGIQLFHDGVRPSGFRLAIAAPVAVWLDGRPVDDAAARLGPDMVALGREALERVGLGADAEGGVLLTGESSSGSLPGGAAAANSVGPPPWCWAAGDCVADRPRDWLEAIESGIRAGRAASRG